MAEENDPNWLVYQDARRRAEAFGVEVVPIPSPGRVMHGDEVVPFSAAAEPERAAPSGNVTVIPLRGAGHQVPLAAIAERVWALFPPR